MDLLLSRESKDVIQAPIRLHQPKWLAWKPQETIGVDYKLKIHPNHLNVMKSFTTSYFVTSVLKEFGKCYMGNVL